MPNFVHLHTHTEYSLLDGLSKIKQLVKKTKELEMDALAITDHGAMYGAIEFYKTCKDANIKPIIGCELYVAPRSHKNKEGKLDTEPFHLTVLAKNYQGYLNLMKLVSISHLEGFYYKPRVDKELLKEFHEGLICLSGCPAGEFIKALDTGSGLKKAEGVAKTYLEIFGEGNFYFELQNHFYSELLKKEQIDPAIVSDLENMGKIQDLTWKGVRSLSTKLGIPYVATNDLHYINEEDANAQDALVCIQTAKLLTDINRLRMIDTPNLYLKSSQEMQEAFKSLPQSLENTVKIADKCNLEIPLGNPKFPLFEILNNKKPIEYLKELTFEKAPIRMKMNDERIQRLEYELSVIEKKNYATYFLVVSDFMNWAQEKGIITNTRGSAAGSLVLYVLGVTNVDPIFYMLPFERFMNPFRPSLPDIDVDMADDRRDEVIDYVSKKYGQDRVAHIITFGTMMGRAAIRDIGRVMAVSYGEVDKIAKMVPPPHQGFHKSLADAIKDVPELKKAYSDSMEYERMLDLATKVESTVRHASVHAAGVVIAPDSLTKFTPLQKEANGDKIVTQYDMFAVEDVGLVKMDFLGIRNLSILGRAVEFVKKNRGIEVNLQKIPLDDKKVFEILSKGETMGLFQLEGSGMTKYLVDLKPTNIFDIMAMIALYRPGPLSIIPEYIHRKHHPSKITYFNPKMKDYLERSLGLLVYQDDVLLTAINIAGYSWEEADKFRKAMGKKIPSEMARQKDKFINGVVENGMLRGKAEELFKLIEPFAAYGFNKAHAASYAMISYQTAYMKANFPVEFMAAVMTAEYGDAEKIAAAIEECKRMKIVVLAPDINYSETGFSLEEQAIRFGLSAIKNVGILAIVSIIQAREEKPFDNLLDICSRVDTRLVNRKTLESLIKAGALDTFGSRAAQLLALDQCLDQVHKNLKSRLSGQASLFGDEDLTDGMKVELPQVEEMPLERILAFEKELLGFYLHEPPYINKLKMISRATSPISGFNDSMVGQKISCGGVVMEIKKVFTKKSAKEMAFVTLFDGITQIDCVIFPNLFDEVKSILEKEEVFLIRGKLDKREDKFSLIVDTLEKFDPESIDSPVAEELEIEIPQNADSDLLKKINIAIKKYPGNCTVSLILPTKNGPKRMGLALGVDPQSEFIKDVGEFLGSGTVKMKI